MPFPKPNSTSVAGNAGPPSLTPVEASSVSLLTGPLPVPAFKYKADNSDMVDMAMSWTLCKLDASSSSSLWLRRLAQSKYEIDGRRVSVNWRNQRRTDLLVREDDVPMAEQVPLLDYLRQAASVARSLAAPRSQ